MTREERRALLGDDVIALIHARVKAAPEPSDELVEELRRILAPAADRRAANAMPAAKAA
ncbi:hypothetical protein ACH40E_03175 [Streptomyces acidicola]|uniref:hypothetical protein n=1 Tax=Streptomyces acidicola TaxID=2596892 RepID=UPI0037A79711